jgi:hypothetical protein
LEVTRSGGIGATDRIPRKELLARARDATNATGTKLLICFGGNGRSEGFSAMVRRKNARAAFVENLLALCAKHRFDGVDLNWEYPGYVFGRGYDDEETKKDYAGLFKLVPMISEAFRPVGLVLTMAYYPDRKQEEYIVKGRLHEYMDLMHMMSYVQKHSSPRPSPLGPALCVCGSQGRKTLATTRGLCTDRTPKRRASRQRFVLRYDQSGRHSTLEFGKRAFDH